MPVAAVADSEPTLDLSAVAQRYHSHCLTDTFRTLSFKASSSTPSGIQQMFEPVRGGTRGGQAEFKWSDVSADKDRENYLGHSINAPTGRWQKNKDVHWYNRDKTQSEEARLEEVRKIKEAEADALSIALGFGPTTKSAIPGVPTTGANAIPGPAPKSEPDAPDADAVKAAEKEERRKRKAERREEKLARKEKRRQTRDSRSRSPDRHHRHAYSPDRPLRRSRSPRRRSPQRQGSATRFRRYDSATPPPPPRRLSRRDVEPEVDHTDDTRERERERDRRRWDDNARREAGDTRWGRH